MAGRPPGTPDAEAAQAGGVSYVFRWNKYRPWKGRRCKVIARGRMNSALVEFEDNGERAIISRNAIRRAS